MKEGVWLSMYDMKIKRTIREYNEQLFAKLGHLDKVNKFLKRYKLPKQNQIKVENLKQSTTSRDWISNLKISHKEMSRPNWLHVNSTKHLKNTNSTQTLPKNTTENFPILSIPSLSFPLAPKINKKSFLKKKPLLNIQYSTWVNF